MKPRALSLGAWRYLDGRAGSDVLKLPADHLVTHGVVVGMTGSGKTGLVTVMIEEMLSSGVPTIVVDVKGDLPNLMLAFPTFDPAAYVPWLEPSAEGAPPNDLGDRASRVATERRNALAEHGITEKELTRYSAKTRVRVVSPGSTAGEALHVLSPLEKRSARWNTDPESARGALSAAVSLALRLLGRDPDPARSKEHVLLSLLAERRLLAGGDADLRALLHDLEAPPISEVGALSIDAFFKKTERKKLAAALNTLLASPTFASWRQGAALDIADWVTPRDGRTPGVIVSVAHLDDEERALVLGVLLEEILSWVRSLPGSSRLKAVIVFDEVYGFLPPHPANPPTKRPLVALMKQARAFGVGVIVATQNPMDLDYRALSNAGIWCVGRLQTDADRARVLDGLAASVDSSKENMTELGRRVQRLSNRWFVMRNAHVDAEPLLLRPRYAMSWLRGPMTRGEIQRARGVMPQPQRPSSSPVAPTVAVE
jgi:hypothetical protein